jgi:diamine N-acetyltransferase
MTLRLAELSADNIKAAIDLPLRPGQDEFVAPVAVSIAEAYVTPTAWPRVILDDTELVGFVMANWDPTNEEPAFRAGIWRLNIHADHQRRGVGRFAVDSVAAEARARGVPAITVLWVPGASGPETFYRRLGFLPTGELFGQTLGTLDL